MKYKVFTVLMLVVSFAFSQGKSDNADVVKKGNHYEVTFYHDNGVVAQKGFLTADKKLDGTWKAYNREGKKVSMGHYEAGKKTGRWLFWSNNRLTEVDYHNYEIASVHEWRSKTQLAITD